MKADGVRCCCFAGKKIKKAKMRDNREEQAAGDDDDDYDSTEEAEASSQIDITVSSEDLAKKRKCIHMQCISCGDQQA
jgi:hypothetical protein